MANCANGEERKINTGLFYICQYGDNKHNHCKFVKMCVISGHYKMASVGCKDFSKNKKY